MVSVTKDNHIFSLCRVYSFKENMNLFSYRFREKYSQIKCLGQSSRDPLRCSCWL
jgi:hypothetical protein